MCFVFKSRSAGLAVRALFGFICVCLELGLRRVGKQGIMRVPPPPGALRRHARIASGVDCALRRSSGIHTGASPWQNSRRSARVGMGMSGETLTVVKWGDCHCQHRGDSDRHHIGRLSPSSYGENHVYQGICAASGGAPGPSRPRTVRLVFHCAHRAGARLRAPGRARFRFFVGAICGSDGLIKCLVGSTSVEQASCLLKS